MDVTTIVSPEDCRYRQQTRQERKGRRKEVGGALAMRSLFRVLWEEDACQALAQAEFTLICSCCSLRKLQKARTKVKQGDDCTVSMGLAPSQPQGSTPPVIAQTQKIVKKFVLNCPQHKIPSLLLLSIQKYAFILFFLTYAQNKITFQPVVLFLQLHLHIFYQLDESSSNSLKEICSLFSYICLHQRCIQNSLPLPQKRH